MKDLVVQSISELLFAHKRVVLEGLGVFETKAKKAQFDQVQGLVQPPGAELSFQHNKDLQDSVLKEYLVTEKGMTKEAADENIRTFVGETISQMDKKEIVSLPKIGRLYIDFEKNIQFLPDKTNFSKETFGLPTLNFFPVLRNKEEAIAAIAATTNTPIPPSPVNTGSTTTDSSNWLTKVFPWLLGIALVIVLGIFYWYWKTNNTQGILEDPDKITEMDGRVNTSPSKQKAMTDSTAVQQEDTPVEQPKDEQSTIADETEVPEKKEAPPVVEKEKEKPTPQPDVQATKPVPPGSKECVIIVGGFASRDNAQRMIQEVTKAGYDAYSDTKGGLNRVGVSFYYKNDSEIEDKLKELKNQFNSSSWVLKY
jgi:nucleoid DNA-binding protein